MPQPPGRRGEMDQAVGRAADRLQHHQRVAERRRRHQRARLRAALLGERDRPPAARLGRAQPVGVGRRNVAASGSARPMVSTMQAIVLAVPITMQVPTDGASRPLTASISSPSMRPPRKSPHRRRQSVQAPSVSPLVVADQHRPDRNEDRRHVGRRRGHHLRRQRLVAAADQHHRIHRLRAHHLLGVHRHQVAQEHAGRIGERLVDRDRRELHRQAAGQHHAALDRLDQLGHVAVAGVVVAEGVGDADDRPLQRVVGIAHRLDEGLAQEQREVGVAVRRQASLHSLRRGHADHHTVATARTTTERAKSRPGSGLRSDCGGRPCGPTPLRCSVCGRAA